MTTDAQLIALVDAIVAESGRNAKEERLAELAAVPDGRELIKLCYSPFITFGVTCKKMPDRGDENASGEFWSSIVTMLDRLARRELSGNAAREAVDASFAMMPEAGRRLLYLCLNKDLKAGVNISSIKAVDPTLVPTFAVMRAHPYEEKRVAEFPVAVEPKLDGFRVTFIAKDGSGGFFTRTGKVIEDLDHLVAPTLEALRHWVGVTRLTNGQPNPVLDFLATVSCVKMTPQIVLDGEIMPDSGQFNDVKRAMKEGRVVYNIFDMLTWEDFDAMGAVELAYLHRRLCVQDFNAFAKHVTDRIAMTDVTLANTHDEIQAIYQRHRAAGHEGAMVKSLTGHYHKKKTYDWMKIKNEDTEDLPVVGVFQGQAGGKYEGTIGGLIVDRNGVEVRVSGLDDAIRAEIWKLWFDTCMMIGLAPNVGYEGVSFKLYEAGGPGPLLGRLIEVEFNEATEDGSLRHPRFVRFRDDKTGEIDK